MAEFGYNTIGGIKNQNHLAAAIYLCAHLYSPAEDGVLDSIFIYTRPASVGTIQVKFALYDDSDDSLVAETEEIDVIYESAWYEAAVIGDVDVFAAKSYHFAFKQSDGQYIALDSDSVDRKYDIESYGDPWPNPGNWATDSGKPYRYSAYATYTPGAVEMSGTIAAQSGVTGALQVDRKLAGVIAAQSGLSGSLTIEGIVELAGLIAAQSGLTGALHVDRELAGVIAAQSGLSGSLTVEAQPVAGGTFASLTRDFWWLD